ncbi:prolyl oligopeptidase family serine peptidase [Neobacillus sp.]|uniref:prolyl oligopeptidase family serine peptidase n=1 Tax=Neobacillus sp. TaxID=2675273 RepID=UPI00289ECA13|nr:prolyl oligopeptidase family serine peptidase [Neobacillus sp.]
MEILTKKEDAVDNFHGVLVPDPYRWLEDSNSPESKQWTDEQNEKTKQYLNAFPERQKIKETLISLSNYPKYSLPQKEGDFFYYHLNTGLQKQPVFYRGKSLIPNELDIVINPNTLNEEGTAALTNITFSNDGSMMAYAISYNGSDWQDVKIKNLKTGLDYPEVLKWCKFCSIAWKDDNSGFYYDRYPNPITVAPEDESNYNRIFWHSIDSTQDDDNLIYEISDRKELSYTPQYSDDQRYLVLKVLNGTEPKSRIHYQDIENPGAFIPLINDGEAYYSFLGNEGSTFYLYTNNNAPKGRVIAVDLNKPNKENWKEIIPEQNDPISIVKIIHQHFVISYTHNAYNQLKIYDLNGIPQKNVSLPSFITINDISGKKSDSVMYIGYSSFLHPTKIVSYDFEKDQLIRIWENEFEFEANDYETTQVFYPSKDGTMIPMFLTHKKGLAMTGDNPVLLYGYGGYNVTLTPSFSASQRLWIQSGGIYAVANIRGGGEFGDEWHLAGILEKKQNSFDDFITAADWLIQKKYTSSQRLAIMGGSNGGLLVGACITQRPELFGAALCLVPVTDMLRFHHFTVGRFWTTEFGNAELNPSHFQFMYKYSPLHNVKEGTKYPPTLITTADTDDRVVPLHAMKFAATLQAAQEGDQPILLRVEKNAGHGHGKPTSKIIEEETDLYTFLFKALKINFEEASFMSPPSK